MNAMREFDLAQNSFFIPIDVAFFSRHTIAKYMIIQCARATHRAYKDIQQNMEYNMLECLRLSFAFGTYFSAQVFFPSFI